MAAYTRCLRCAGAPRRPASGSGLSLHIPSWHAVLSDPGESDIDMFQNFDADIGLRRMTTGSALPILPQSVPRGPSFSWLHWFASATYVVHHICSGMWRRLCGAGAGNIPVDCIIEHLTPHILARLIGPRHQRRRIDHARRTVREAGYCRSLSGWTGCRGPRALPAAGKRRRAFPLDAEADRLGAALRGGGGSEPWRKHQLHTANELALPTHPTAQWAAAIGVYCQTVPKVWRALAAQHRRSAARQ